MTDNEGQNRQGKQLLLTTESETKQTNEKPNKANEPISKLSYNRR